MFCQCFNAELLIEITRQSQLLLYILARIKLSCKRLEW